MKVQLPSCTHKMGVSQSNRNSGAEMVGDERAPSDARALSLQLSEAKARAKRSESDAVRYRMLADSSWAEAEALRQEKEQIVWFGVAGAVGSAAVAAALGAAVAAANMRRRNVAALSEAAQEMVDVRRRAAFELDRAKQYGGEKLARTLVPALDALDALCEAGGGDPEGANLTRRSMHDALRANGVERCEPAVGDKFDVSMMEAVFTVPVAEGQATGNVEEVFRPGYLLHERVLRAAQVGVGAPPPAPPTDTTTD
jgi:molecular chaperone GrpE